MVTKTQVIQALRSEFPDIEEGLEFIRSTHRITGIVISKGFEKQDHRSRQNHLWKALEKNLSKQDLQSIGPIAALTPHEAEIKAADVD